MAAASLMANFHFLKVNNSLPQNRQRSSDKHSSFAFKIGIEEDQTELHCLLFCTDYTSYKNPIHNKTVTFNHTFSEMYAK